MDKMKMESMNLTSKNIEQLERLFPNVVTEILDKENSTPENKVYKKGINFSLLKQMLSEEVEEEGEAYELNWVGKRACMAEANSSTRKTLRPVLEESRNWETTKNLYIEGDNLEVLKLLQESYLNRVKVIYIDPPYNTGKDFLYRDRFAMSAEEFKEEIGMFDEEGNRLFQNPESSGRFHSDWCSMIYPRVLLSRNLLSEDGVIFISIDDREVDNMKKICNEIFGEINFVACIVWQRAYAPVNMNKWFSPNHDYALVYAKNIEEFHLTKLARTEKQNKDYQNIDNDPRGPWKAGNPSVGPAVEKNIYEVELPSGRKVLPPAGRSWVYSQEKLKEMIKDNRIYFGKDGDSVWAPKMFLNEVSDGVTPLTLWTYNEVGHSQDATKELKKLFGNISVFDYSKPVEYIKRMVHLGTKKDEENIVMDFFSGSATTAHAVMELNAEDHGNRRFIMVQLQEECDKKSEAYKAGYKNICEIGKERIRLAANKIIGENIDTEGLDIGYRVFKLDSGNMKDVYYPVKAYTKEMLLELEDNIKEDRTDMDLLFNCLLDWGLELDKPHEVREMMGKKVHIVGDNELIACFEKEIKEEVVEEIGRKQPARVVFRDASFKDSISKLNAEEILKKYAPGASVKVI